MDAILVRRLDLATFTGDAWAATGTQGAVPAAAGELMNCTATPVRWVAIPMDGLEDGASVVTDTTTTIDARLVKVAEGLRDVDITAMVSPLSVTSGGEQVVGLELTDGDVDPGQRFYCGVPAITVGTAAAVWIYVLSGAVAVSGQ